MVIYLYLILILPIIFTVCVHYMTVDNMN